MARRQREAWSSDRRLGTLRIRTMGQTEREIAAHGFVSSIIIAMLATAAMLGVYLIELWLAKGAYHALGTLIMVSVAIASLCAYYLYQTAEQ